MKPKLTEEQRIIFQAMSKLNDIEKRKGVTGAMPWVLEQGDNYITFRYDPRPKPQLRLVK